MAEYVVHEHHDTTTDGGSNFLVGIVVLAVVVFLLFVYGLPLVRNAMSPQVSIPSKVDVNLNQK